jgi:hypothetical protein
MRIAYLFKRLCNPSPMTLNEKVRYSMMAIGAAGFILAALGLHPGPLDPMSGAGS